MASKENCVFSHLGLPFCQFRVFEYCGSLLVLLSIARVSSGFKDASVVYFQSTSVHKSKTLDNKYQENAPVLQHSSGISLEWTPEEHANLEDNLARSKIFPLTVDGGRCAVTNGIHFQMHSLHQPFSKVIKSYGNLHVLILTIRITVSQQHHLTMSLRFFIPPSSRKSKLTSSIKNNRNF
ncbi:hypothetical protein ACET3Z_017930 [Daucus carota]